MQANIHDKTVKPNGKNERKFVISTNDKATYAVLIGNTARVCNTN